SGTWRSRTLGGEGEQERDSASPRRNAAHARRDAALPASALSQAHDDPGQSRRRIAPVALDGFLRAIGAAAGNAEGGGIESLTGRELEVVRLVADRRTNPEIAAELFLSIKTVETHLRN